MPVVRVEGGEDLRVRLHAHELARLQLEGHRRTACRAGSSPVLTGLGGPPTTTAARRGCDEALEASAALATHQDVERSVQQVGERHVAGAIVLDVLRRVPPRQRFRELAKLRGLADVAYVGPILAGQRFDAGGSFDVLLGASRRA